LGAGSTHGFIVPRQGGRAAAVESQGYKVYFASNSRSLCSVIVTRPRAIVRVSRGPTPRLLLFS
jgi:hypothetical protein